MTGVTVWLAELRGPGVTDLLTLSADELERARRLDGDRARGRWVAAHAFLRRALGRQLGVGAADLRFDVGERGKPVLESGPRFSLAHSGEHALLAICDGAEVGADLELVREDRARPPSAERFFGDREQAALADLAEPARTRRFFQLWTAKEAYRKATGEGIGGGLGELPERGFVLERPPVPAAYEAAVVVLAMEAVFSFATWEG